MSGRVFLLVLVCLFPPAASADERSEQFWVAARKGDAAAVKALLEKGVDVNTKFPYGATALWHAAHRGHVEVVRVLLEHGADVNVKETYFGGTPLSPAAARGDTSIVQMLLDKGAEELDRALGLAVNRGRVEVVKLILDKGGLKPETLSSTWAVATKRGRTDIAELLKKAGASPRPSADFQVDREILRTYAGVYKSRDGMEASFAAKEGKLTGGNIFEDPLVWEPVDRITFKPTGFDWGTITFTLEGDKVVGFTLRQREGSVVFQKVAQK